MTRLRPIGRLLDGTVSPPSALRSSTPSSLNFDPSVHLSVDPSVDLSIGLVLMGGAYCVPQVPVPQTCQPHTHIRIKVQEADFRSVSCLNMTITNIKYLS